MDKLEQQIKNPFYQSVEAFRHEVRLEQFKKAAEKYPTPFNPDHWTGEELANHCMQENYDQSVYITGLRDRVLKQEEEIAQLKLETEFWRLKAMKLAGDKVQLGLFIDERV